MALRETLHKNQKLTLVAVLVVIGIAISFLFIQNKTSDPVAATTSAYFTSDDGASYIGGDARKVREMEAKSPPMYQAVVFRAIDGGSPFVGYITRLPPASQQDFANAMNTYNQQKATLGGDQIKLAKATDDFNAAIKAIMSTTEVKRPGANSKWVLRDSPEGQDILNHVKAPNGSTNVQMVFP